MEPVSVLLVGAHGHGRWHRRNLDRLRREGAPIRLVGICDIHPPDDIEVPAGPRLEPLLDRLRPAITVVCTPIHTHVDLALTAAGTGSHILLEKPPTPSSAEFARLRAGIDAAGVTCQVNFQSLGSAAVPYVRQLVADGAIGAVRGIGAAGAWVRDSGYWTRSPWAGRRALDGVAVVDGALTNPFAHATATALALDGTTDQEPDRVDVELYRANPIEADDTACLRLVSARGTPIVVAVTLCAAEHVEPYVTVHGTRGRITLFYKSDRVQLSGADPTRHAGTDLLTDLAGHVRDRSRPLLVPLSATTAFMRVVEAVRTADPPREIPPAHRRTEPTEGHTRQVVVGIDEAVRRAASDLLLFSELGLPWAAAAVPHG
jgi:predicted dehydrogenase